MRKVILILIIIVIIVAVVAGGLSIYLTPKKNTERVVINTGLRVEANDYQSDPYGTIDIDGYEYQHLPLELIPPEDEYKLKKLNIGDTIFYKPSYNIKGELVKEPKEYVIKKIEAGNYNKQIRGYLTLDNNYKIGIPDYYIFKKNADYFADPKEFEKDDAPIGPYIYKVASNKPIWCPSNATYSKEKNKCICDYNSSGKDCKKCKEGWAGSFCAVDLTKNQLPYRIVYAPVPYYEKTAWENNMFYEYDDIDPAPVGFIDSIDPSNSIPLPKVPPEGLKVKLIGDKGDVIDNMVVREFNFRFDKLKGAGYPSTAVIFMPSQWDPKTEKYIVEYPTVDQLNKMAKSRIYYMYLK